MDPSIITEDALNEIRLIDEELSKRFIALDPSGYFIIKVDRETKELIVEHYGNDIDELGRAIDQETGEPLECSNSKKQMPIKIYKGRSAKELGTLLTEREGSNPVSRLDHAMYLGRELQRAEDCLINGKAYIQD